MARYIGPKTSVSQFLHNLQDFADHIVSVYQWVQTKVCVWENQIYKHCSLIDRDNIKIEKVDENCRNFCNFNTFPMLTIIEKIFYHNDCITTKTTMNIISINSNVDKIVIIFRAERRFVLEGRGEGDRLKRTLKPVVRIQLMEDLKELLIIKLEK